MNNRRDCYDRPLRYGILRGVRVGVMVALLLCMQACGPECPSDGDGASLPDEAATKVLLEQAAAAPLEVMQEFVRLGGKVSAGEPGVTFTWLVFLIRLGEEEESNLEFLLGAPKDVTPSALVKGLAEQALTSDSETVSLLHRWFITELSVYPSQSGFRGTARFHVPGLLRGSVEYRAVHKPDGWEVIEFELPRDRLKTERGADGHWRASNVGEGAQHVGSGR